MELLKKAWAFVDGKKSYIIAALLVVLSGLRAEGFISPELYEALLTLLGGLGLAAARHAISKS